MFSSLQSLEFLIFAPLVVVFVALTKGRLREFCLLGWVLIRSFTSGTQQVAMFSAVLLVTVFIYLRDYEFLGWFLPADARLSFLQTIGLSFLLFRILHVMIDARSQMIERVDPVTYANYLLAFTTFMMGPIQRFQDFQEQWTDRSRAIEMSFEAHFDAGLRILWGFTKVYVIGSALNGVALQPDTDVLSLSPMELWVQLAGFYFFLYMNFSGYCDIVIGLGSLMGVRPPENFNHPYLAQNISDFWLRQHRSLTLWLTNYVFNPVYKWALSSRLFASSLLAGILAAMLTMFISGIWHGTTIGFLIFGLVHGLWLSVYRVWDHVVTAQFGKKRMRQIRASLPGRVIGILLTFHAAAFAFLFFQLDTPSVLRLLEGIF